jgi:hypothetical protein
MRFFAVMCVYSVTMVPMIPPIFFSGGGPQ